MESTECESQLKQAIMITRNYEFIRAQTEFILNLPSSSDHNYHLIIIKLQSPDSSMMDFCYR